MIENIKPNSVIPEQRSNYLLSPIRCWQLGCSMKVKTAMKDKRPQGTMRFTM